MYLFWSKKYLCAGFYPLIFCLTFTTAIIHRIEKRIANAAWNLSLFFIWHFERLAISFRSLTLWGIRHCYHIMNHAILWCTAWSRKTKLPLLNGKKYWSRRVCSLKGLDRALDRGMAAAAEATLPNRPENRRHIIILEHYKVSMLVWADERILCSWNLPFLRAGAEKEGDNCSLPLTSDGKNVNLYQSNQCRRNGISVILSESYSSIIWVHSFLFWRTTCQRQKLRIIKFTRYPPNILAYTEGVLPPAFEFSWYHRNPSHP